jgi:integrase/recombinase XerC
MLRALNWARAGSPTLGATSVYDGEDVGEKVRPWSDAELAALLAACDTPELESLILLAADAGLRLAEVCALVWEDVNLTEKTLTVRNGKGGSTATLPMTLRLADSLRRSRSGTGRVIPHSRRDVQRMMDAIIAASGVDKRGRGYHALRHTAGTRAARIGGVLAAQRLLRHRTLGTVTIYARLADDELRGVVETMGET